MFIVLYHEMYGFDCYSPFVKCSLALLEPRLVRDPLAISLQPPFTDSYVITLFVDATIIPLTLSADATCTP